MSDSPLRTVITSVVIALVIVLFMIYLVLPAIIRAMDQIDAQHCRQAFEVTSYITERCAEFIGK